jgi:hypothetical protein
VKPRSDSFARVDSLLFPHILDQGTLTEGDGSEQLTSLLLTHLDQLFMILKTFLHKSYLNEEVIKVAPQLVFPNYTKDVNVSLGAAAAER